MSIRDKDTGRFTIMGRIDDVLNASDHRMGAMEIACRRCRTPASPRPP